jgi:hypothetical protein
LPIPDDADPDVLISRLAGPLAPADRVAFRRAAEAALALLPCAGEGLAYRVVAALQRSYRVPPDDRRAAWGIEQAHHHASKLAQGPPIERGRDFRFTRHLRLTR